MNNKKEKGITLIALVVTIVILLILAGVSMTMVIGENGIIKKAKDARENQVHSAVKEGIILTHNQYTIEDGTGESNSTTFKDYIEGKGIIDENGIINVVNLLGKKQHLGNGSNTETGDVYVFEESDDVYRVKYYDEKKEEHLIDEFEKGSTGEDWAETDPKYFEVDDDGTIRFKYEYQEAFYRETAKWTEENLVIPEEIDGKKVTKIANEFCVYIDNIKTIKIPNTVTSIGHNAFYGVIELTSIVIPDSVTSIGNSAFRACRKLTNIKIPNNVTSIGDDTFEDCESLKNIVIPNNVTSIGENAFCGCSSLTDIIIPASVIEIGERAFDSCSGLNSISVTTENKNYDSRNDCNAIIEKKTNTLIAGCRNTIIPESITDIGTYAFCGCTGLTEIIIPNSVKNIGERAFRECTSLTDIIIPNGVVNIEDEAFDGAGLEKIQLPNSLTSIGRSAFLGCSALTTVNYTGTEEEWSKITIGSCNYSLEDATIVYNYIPSNQ